MKIKPENILNFAPEIDFSRILTNPILDIAARVWENDRYEAFRICYRSMRVIDDLIDDRKEKSSAISEKEIKELSQTIDNWVKGMENNIATDDFHGELLRVIAEFKIPLFPWVRLAKAMKYDLHHNGFKNFATFLRYTEGAAIAPAAIFVHLCGVTKGKDKITPPAYDIRKEARELALFSYLVHILRDFQKDQLAGLNYFAFDLMSQNQLNLNDLRKIAGGSKISPKFRNLIAKYHQLASYYRNKSRVRLDNLRFHLEPQYQLSLELIFSLYDQIYEKIKPETGLFTPSELNPEALEIKKRIAQTISSFGTSETSKITKQE